MSIIVSREGGETTKLDESGVESEGYLQEYISRNPQSIPLDDYKDDIHFSPCSGLESSTIKQVSGYQKLLAREE